MYTVLRSLRHEWYKPPVVPPYQCFLFQNETKYCLDTLNQANFFQIIKINNFRGELTDNSAKKEALLHMPLLRRELLLKCSQATDIHARNVISNEMLPLRLLVSLLRTILQVCLDTSDRFGVRQVSGLSWIPVYNCTIQSMSKVPPPENRLVYRGFRFIGVRYIETYLYTGGPVIIEFRWYWITTIWISHNC